MQRVPFASNETLFEVSSKYDYEVEGEDTIDAVTPIPSLVLKSKILNTEQKFFINLCTCDSASEKYVSSNKLGKCIQYSSESLLTVIALGHVLDTVDKYGVTSFSIDVVVDCASLEILNTLSDDVEDEDYDLISFSLVKFISEHISMNIDLMRMTYPKIKGNYKGDTPSMLPIFLPDVTKVEVRTRRPSRLALVAEQKKIIQEGGGVQLWNESVITDKESAAVDSTSAERISVENLKRENSFQVTDSNDDRTIATEKDEAKVSDALNSVNDPDTRSQKTAASSPRKSFYDIMFGGLGASNASGGDVSTKPADETSVAHHPPGSMNQELTPPKKV